jgi:hypothetical protein
VGVGDGPSRQQGPSDHRAANATKAMLPEMSRPFACRCTYQSAIRRWVPLSAPRRDDSNGKALTQTHAWCRNSRSHSNRDFGNSWCLGPLSDLAALEKGIDVALSLRPLKAIFRHHLRDQIIPTF